MQNSFNYNLKIDGEISGLLGKLETLKKSMKTAMDAGKAPGAAQVFEKLEKELEQLREKSSKPIISMSQFEKIKSETDGVAERVSKLGLTVEKLLNMDSDSLKELIPTETKKNIEGAGKALETYKKAVKEAEKESKELTTAKKELAKAEKEAARKTEEIATQKQLVEGQRAEVQSISEKKKALEEYLKAKKSGGSVDKGVANAAKAVDPNVESQSIEDIEGAVKRLNKELQQGEAQQRKYETGLKELNAESDTAQSRVQSLKGRVQELDSQFKKDSVSSKKKAYKELSQEMSQYGISVDKVVSKNASAETKINRLTEEINRMETNAIESVKVDLQEMGTNMENVGGSAKQLGTAMNGASKEVEQLDNKVKNGQAFAQRMAQFVGLQGGIQLARRAMRDAMQTIKELDKQMTEMAVVTDLEIGDYWNQLPEHTSRANALGMAIKDVYEAETLYYQQGLKTNQVTAMSTETLKMARIAGLSAKDATDKMTAALRGFNMELDETSTQRVADVYSELAAITASDVNEISEAMTKTASIASSAGMEFETTAAFLSQIIETTRESAETAGTALKTVIARFQELKKDPSEIGEVDGEIIDANQIETALRSVGVALRDTSGQFRSLDEVFLELSSKWDDLDTNTQRYIATIAAGSRQQSRFIAMMQDYNRTQELVSAANNSTGASNEQFEKTMDSLETKLNQLKNAWNTFVMGIMDSDMLKIGISILTALMETINGIIAIFDKVGLGGAASIALVVSALYLGAKAIDVFSLNLKKTGSITKAFGATVKTGFNSITRALHSFGNTHAKTMAKSEAAQKSYSQQMKYSQAIIKRRNIAEAEGTLTAKGRAGAEKNLAATYQAQVATMTEYGIALGFNNAQIASATTLAGVATSTDMAYKAVLGGLTTEKFKEFTATMIANGMSEEEIRTRQEAIIATYAQSGAEEFENKTAKKGLLFKIKNYAALLFGNKAKRKAALSSLGLAGAEKVQTGATGGATGAQWGLNAAIYACPLGWIALAIMAVIAALALLIVAFSKASDAAKMKALQQQEKSLNEQLENTKQLTEDLHSKWEEYTSVQKTLDGLVVGTKEWNEKLIEANNQVIELIKTYPKLNRYLQSENGRLTIDEAGYEQIAKEMQQSVSNLNLAKQRNYVAQEQLNIKSKADDLYENSGLLTNEKLQGAVGRGTGLSISPGNPLGVLNPIVAPFREKAISWVAENTESLGILGDFLTANANAIMGGGIRETLGLMFTGSIGRAIEAKGESNLSDFAYEAQQRGITLENQDKTELAALYKEIFNSEMTDDFYESMQKNADAFYDLAASIDGIKRQQEAYADSLMQSAAEMADVTGEWSNTAIALGRTTLNGEEAQKRLAEETKAIKNDTSKKMALQQYASLMGYGYKNGKLYSSQSEMTSDTKIEVDMDLVYESLAENKIKQDEGRELIQIERALNKVATKLDKEERAQLKRIASGNANELTRSDLKLIEQSGGIKEYLQGIGMDQQTIDSLDIDYQEINEEISKGIIDAERRNTDFRETVGITKGSTEDANLAKVLEGTTLGQANNIQSQITTLQDTYGGDIGKDILDLIANSGFTGETQQLLNQQIGSITDWTDAEQIAGLSEAMKTFGDITTEDEIAINALEDTLITVAMATRKIDIAALKTFVVTLTKTTEEIKKGNRNIDTDTYDALKKSGMDMSMFVETAEGFRYLGDAADFVRESSVVAYDQMSQAKENFNSLLGKTESSIAGLEEAYKTVVVAQTETQEDTRSGWQKLQDWFSYFINKIKSIFTTVWGGIVKAFKVGADFIGNCFNTIWDGIAWAFNKGSDLVASAIEWLVNGLIKLINWVIKQVNKIPGINIKTIDEVKIDNPRLKTSAEREQERKLAESIENLRNNLSDLAQGAEEYASSLLSSADAIEAGAILESREQVEQKKKELEAEKAQKKQQYGNNWTTELEDSYTEALEALDKVLAAADTALLSKAYAFEDLAPVAKEFQQAIASGNKDAIEFYRLQITNALNLKEATDTMVNSFEHLKNKIEIVEKLGTSSKEAVQYLRQMSYYMGFSNIEEGTKFVKNNFDLIKNAIDGNIESITLLQERFVSYLGIDPSKSTLDSGLRQIYDSDKNRGREVLNSLLDSGMFHLELATATSASQVMDISYDSGVAAINGTRTVSAGDQYYTLVAADSSQLADTAQLLGTLEAYESAYDWLYMLNQTLEESIRKKEKMEKKYSAVLDEEGTTYNKLFKARQSYINSLKEERESQQSIVDARRENSDEMIKEIANDDLYKDLLNYLIFEKDINGNNTGRVTVSEDYLNADISDETKKLYDEYIDKFIENSDAIDEANDSIEDIDDTLKEEEKKGKEETEDLYDRVKEALINDKQEQIDILNEINDSIVSMQESLVNKIQEQIDDARQARENEEKEQEITDKETRLAYLMRDSSDVNMLEIASLQKEIDEAKQSYSDDLIDQSIEKLQDANDKAAEQRERQIQLAESQLAAYENSTQIWNDAAAIVTTSLEELKNGVDIENTPLGNLLYKWEVVKENLNPFAEEAWFEELSDVGSLAAIYGKSLRKVLHKSLLNPVQAYKDGGLADFTGPAWLDGTKSKPEMVLNQQDTANFIVLKDILSEILSGTSFVSKEKSGKNGDNYFDIDINVDNIGEDYDVEQLADKIRSMIYEDASYRNVNTINSVR